MASKTLGKKIEKALETGRIEQIEPEGNRIEELYTAVKLLKDRASWIKNIGIKNKKEERKRFKQAREDGESYIPDFEFEEPEQDLDLLNRALDRCMEISEEIEKEDIEKFSPEKLGREDLQKFFSDIFRELQLYVKLAENIEEEQEWQKYSEKIWPMVDQSQVDRSKKDLKEGLDKIDRESDRKVTAEEMKNIWEDQLESLGIEYTVEVREVSGCFNIPEDRTVVVAKGVEDERLYSKNEVKMLTMHELFHVIRAYNGFKAGERSGFPPILGVHTPFYDRTEEGGALTREEKTGVRYGEKWFDWNLRLLAAYELSQAESFREEFEEIVEKLVDLGGDPERCFDLLARNREALRHHIYAGGYRDWKERTEEGKELWPLLIGKLNQRWADRFGIEAEAGGMIQKPEIGEEAVFNHSFDFRFKDS